MSATHNADVVVNVHLDAPPQSVQGFGIPLLAMRGLGVGFVERVRVYETPADAASDTDLSTAARNALNAIFSQKPRCASVLVGRIEDDAAQIITFTFSGTPEVGDILVITIDGQATPYTVAGTVLNVEVGALRTALDAALGAAYVVGGAGAVITVTAAVAGEPFDYGSEVTLVGSGDLDVEVNETQENVSFKTELDAILADNDTWYGVIPGSRTDVDIQRVAEWVEADDEHFHLAQSSAAGLLTSATNDVASTLKDLNYTRTAILYHALDSEHAAAAWAGKKLAADPDRQTTQWDKAPLIGITPDKISATQKANATAKNVNLYLPFFSRSVTGPGKRINGDWIDLLITADWSRARIREGIANEFVRVSDQNRKIPLSDAGIQVFVAIVLAVLNLGIEVGHFLDGTIQIDAPDLVDISAQDLANRTLSFEFSVAPAGAIHSVTITGYVSVTFAQRLAAAA